MKVNCISKNSNVYFTAGKVSLYSDFDGTYLPERHGDLNSISQERLDGLNAYYKRFGNFLENTRGDFSFSITTGRTFGEFETVSELLRSKGIVMPFPDSLITKNGSDEFIRQGSGEEFYTSGKFPYEYNSPNQAKEEKIQTLSGWNKTVRAKIKELLEARHFEVIEHDSEHSAVDYGEKSLMQHVKYDSFELTDDMKAQSDWNVGLRRDGNLKVSMSFPYDMRHVGERSYVYDELKKDFEKFFNENNIKFVPYEFRDAVGGNRPTLEYSPQMADGSALSKLYDTKEAVKQAVLNNDLVITAGDGMNDFEMLNPLNYIEREGLEEGLQKELAGMTPENISKLAENPTIAERVRKLPFVGIVIKNESSELENLSNIFEEKIIVIENGKLLEGIHLAVEKYSKICPEFAKNLTDSFKSKLGIILSTPNEYVNVVSEESKAVKNSVSGGKIAAIVGGLTAGVSAIVLALKQHNKNKEH